MKFKHFLFLLVCLSMTVFHSCKDDKDDIEDFLGTYATEETCDGYNYTYDIVISEAFESDNTVNIANLYDIGETINAAVNGNNISFSQTIIEDGYSIIFVGDGTLSDDVLTINFTYSEDGYMQTCVAVATRK